MVGKGGMPTRLTPAPVVKQQERLDAKYDARAHRCSRG
jgi:hypothetical protein